MLETGSAVRGTESSAADAATGVAGSEDNIACGLGAGEAGGPRDWGLRI